MEDTHAELGVGSSSQGRDSAVEGADQEIGDSGVNADRPRKSLATSSSLY